MKKIKEIIVYYPSFERGGATVNLINFINEAIKNKIKIYLISNINNKDKKKFISKKVNFLDIKVKSNIFTSTRIYTSLMSIYFMLNTFNKVDKNKSILISFQSHIIPIIFSKIFNKKIVIRNSEDVLGATKYAENKVFAYIVLLLKIIIYPLANGIITNSTKSKKSLEKILLVKKKIKLIFNPYLKKIYNHNNNKRKNTILSVGRLCKQKNQETAIKAFNLFIKKFSNYKLIILGHGYNELKLKNMCDKLGINKKVKFMGWINRKSSYYKLSKILIFPSLYEGSPNALIDSVNYELPVISTKCSGAEDILTKKNGLFVNYYDYKTLSSKMIKTVINYNKSLYLIKQSKKKLNRFLVKRQVSSYLTYCNSILKDY